MHEDVSKGDNAAQFRDVVCDLRVDLSKPRERLADDFKLAFYRRAQQIVFNERLVRLDVQESLHCFRGLQRIP